MTYPTPRDYVLHLRVLEEGREPSSLHGYQSGSGECPGLSRGGEGGSQGEGPERGFSQGWDKLAGGLSLHWVKASMVGNSAWTSRGWERVEVVWPQEPALGVLPTALNFFSFNIMKFFKHTEKMKEFYDERLYTHHLDWTINVLWRYPSIHSRIHRVLKCISKLQTSVYFPPKYLSVRDQ